MFKRLDQWLENKFKKKLHKKRQKITQKSVENFKKTHPEVDPTDFIKLAESEADRIYAFVDKSILRERIQRAKVTFWITAIIGIIIAFIINGFTVGAALPATIATIPAFVAWAANISTIPISYNQRIKGGMDSVLVNYEKILREKEAYQNESVKVELSFAQIMAIIELSKKNIPKESMVESLNKESEIHLSLSEKKELQSLFFSYTSTHQPPEEKDFFTKNHLVI